MASVAICPHCYLQLAIPEQAASDAQIECPSCHSEFALEKATVRKIPQGVLKDSSAPAEAAAAAIALPAPKLAEAGPLPEAAKHADADIAAWFRSNKTVPEVAPIVSETASGADEPADDGDTIDSDLEDDAVTNAEDPTLMDDPRAIAEESHDEAATVRPSAVTLADWQALRTSTPEPVADLSARLLDESDKSKEPIAEPVGFDEFELEDTPEEAVVPGPSFDLPDVPLTRTNATVEFSGDDLATTTAADFELADVDFDSSDDSWLKGEKSLVGESTEPADIANSETMPDLDVFDERSTHEPSLQLAAEEPATDYYEHSTSSIDQDHQEDHEEHLHDLPPSLPPQRGGRRKRSALRTVVSAVAGAPVGLAIGYFAVLWIAGPRGDFLQMAKYIPPNLLPASFASTTPRRETVVPPRPEPIAETPAEPAEPIAKDSATIPASFESPAELPAAKPASDDVDRYAANTPSPSAPSLGGPSPGDAMPAEATSEEPRRFTPPAAGAIGGDEAHIVGAPLFTVAEFATTLSQAEKAEAGLVSGDLSDPAVRGEKGRSYSKLCDLAQMVTFCDDPSAADRLTELRHNADEIFQKTLATPHTRDEVARIAAIWIDSPHRKHGGVFMAGTIHGGEIAGNTYEYQLSTEAGGDLPLLLPRPLDTHAAAADHPVAIVGSIVDDPARKVSGYTGASPRVIWVRDIIPLD
jgi:hypothetical protein